MSAGDKDACLTSGMDDYLVKPFTAKLLLQVLVKYISGLAVLVPAESEKRPLNESVDRVSGSDVNDELINRDAIDDIKALEQKSGRKIYDRVLQAFQQEMAAKIPLLAQHMAQQEGTSLAKVAHAMKSLCGNVGARKLQALCLTIEQAALTADFVACQQDVADVVVCYQQTSAALAQISKE
jgi:HPt (histidine-containing phosphotransfer) domain-containing protein